MAPILTAEDVVRRIAAECTYVDDRGGVGIRLEPAAAIVRRYGEQFRRQARQRRTRRSRTRLHCSKDEAIRSRHAPLSLSRPASQKTIPSLKRTWVCSVWIKSRLTRAAGLAPKVITTTGNRHRRHAGNRRVTASYGYLASCSGTGWGRRYGCDPDRLDNSFKNRVQPVLYTVRVELLSPTRPGISLNFRDERGAYWQYSNLYEITVSLTAVRLSPDRLPVTT